MYHEYATTVASVMISPSSSAVVGDRVAAVTVAGLYQYEPCGVGARGGSTTGLPARTVRDTRQSCMARAEDRTSHRFASRPPRVRADHRRRRGRRTGPRDRA